MTMGTSVTIALDLIKLSTSVGHYMSSFIHWMRLDEFLEILNGLLHRLDGV